MKKPEFELVVYGASSFVGHIICRYLALRTVDMSCASGTATTFRWAIAGRSEQKLSALRQSLRLPKLPILIAEINDPDALATIASRTRVVLSTVGPYALFGEPMVKACVEAGTGYCDLTGEPQWIRAMIEKFQAQAERTGAVLLPASGFDSVPSDLGVWLLQQRAIARHGAPLSSIKMRVKSLRGGASGGTIASMLNVIKEASRSKVLRRELADLYSLCPPVALAAKKSTQIRQKVHIGASFDAEHRAWCAPFIMAAINTRVVLRSNALSGRYGAQFRYDEALLTGSGLSGRARATAIATGLGGFTLAAAIAPARWILEKCLPSPGQGPSEHAQLNGHYDLRFSGLAADGSTLKLAWVGDRDPGYGSTAKIISEVALLLAERLKRSGAVNTSRQSDAATQADPHQRTAGFHTSASLFGAALAERLESHAGIKIQIDEIHENQGLAKEKRTQTKA